ncbi:hypothetical protein BDM02DRAFT_826296 [Thelephora ganbajun]|uniref:Uncharacterized protein n=1 Tax=Thelephora ganbajun TaxID=370292 RepID=A0ACB6Z598_THEGA|nr:hypothetical protein BDM02DRAFT_826296 [Thelephora ganbajun]
MECGVMRPQGQRTALLIIRCRPCVGRRRVSMGKSQGPPYIPVPSWTCHRSSSTSRIKYVINERRLGYQGAIQMIAESNKRKNSKLLFQSLRLGRQESPVVVRRTAAERAAAGLVQPDLVRRGLNY